MKGRIYCYSGSGNTRLACHYLSEKMTAATFDLFDITADQPPGVQGYDVVGFAAFTDFLGPSKIFQTFVEQLPTQEGKPAFVLNTYGLMSGRTSRRMAQQIRGRGFKVIAGHSLHTPESYPPQIVRGHSAEDSPSPEEKEDFDRFIVALNQKLRAIKEGQAVEDSKVRIGLINSLIPTLSRTKAKRDMGLKHVDEALCIECGICEQVCPYDAITLSPKPIFDEDRCYGCWACYNHCPERAIYTDELRGAGHYPEPNQQLKQKLSI
jgi:ferredoxin